MSRYGFPRKLATSQIATACASPVSSEWELFSRNYRSLSLSLLAAAELCLYDTPDCAIPHSQTTRSTYWPLKFRLMAATTISILQVACPRRAFAAAVGAHPLASCRRSGAGTAVTRSTSRPSRASTSVSASPVSSPSPQPAGLSWLRHSTWLSVDGAPISNKARPSLPGILLRPRPTPWQPTRADRSLGNRLHWVGFC